MNVPCPTCHLVQTFDQPYLYHAGFANQGFLYDETGTSTLVWSSIDPSYEELVGKVHPWMLTDDARSRLEQALRPSPTGSRWLFKNPPRCKYCGAPVGDSILNTIYYLEYPGSVVLDRRSELEPLASLLIR